MQRPYVAAEARTRNRAVAALPLSKFQPYALSVCQRASDQRERVFTHARKRGSSAARSPPCNANLSIGQAPVSELTCPRRRRQRALKSVFVLATNGSGYPRTRGSALPSAARSPPPTSADLESRAVYGLAYENAFWRDIVPRDVAGA